MMIKVYCSRCNSIREVDFHLQIDDGETREIAFHIPPCERCRSEKEWDDVSTGISLGFSECDKGKSLQSALAEIEAIWKGAE